MTEPLLFEGEEGVGIVGVELEGLTDVRPAHGAGRQGQLTGRCSPGGEGPREERAEEIEEQEEAEDEGQHDEERGGDHGCRGRIHSGGSGIHYAS